MMNFLTYDINKDHKILSENVCVPVSQAGKASKLVLKHCYANYSAHMQLDARTGAGTGISALMQTVCMCVRGSPEVKHPHSYCHLLCTHLPRPAH